MFTCQCTRDLGGSISATGTLLRTGCTLRLCRGDQALRLTATEDLLFRTCGSRHGQIKVRFNFPSESTSYRRQGVRTGAHVRAVADQRFHRLSDPTTAQRVSASPFIPRIPAVSRSRALTVAALCLCGRTTASRSTRRCFLLLPLVFAFVVYRSTETVPSISPVSAKSAGALEALRNTGLCVYVYVRAPDASSKRPVPPVI
jgi:hypothetical protein